MVGVLTTVRWAAKGARWAHRKALKTDILESFNVESTEHALAQLDLLLEAFAQHSEESGESPSWLAALDADPPLSVQELRDALTPVKDTLLRVLRVSQDPILGNQMLARVAAGLNRMSVVPPSIVQRVLRSSVRLIPEDIELLKRYLLEGVERVEHHPHGIQLHTRKLLQENNYIFFIDGKGERSTPIDSYSYQALQDNHLIRDGPWFDPAKRGKRPTMGPIFPFHDRRHEAFRLEWELTYTGFLTLEAFLGKKELIDLLEYLPKHVTG